MKQLKEHLFLIGFMGVGKTSVSRELSRMLGVQEIDTDTMIVEQEGMAINEIFATKGEEYFRQTETSLLDQLRTKAPCILWGGNGYAPGECSKDGRNGTDLSAASFAGDDL